MDFCQSENVGTLKIAVAFDFSRRGHTFKRKSVQVNEFIEQSYPFMVRKGVLRVTLILVLINIVVSSFWLNYVCFVVEEVLFSIRSAVQQVQRSVPRLLRCRSRVSPPRAAVSFHSWKL